MEGGSEKDEEGRETETEPERERERELCKTNRPPDLSSFPKSGIFVFCLAGSR